MQEPLEVQVGEWLRKRGCYLCVAESCTGGLIGHRLTNIPGSSEYFLGGVMVYSYEAKERLIAVSHNTLLQHGAVSQETVIEMAKGVRDIFALDFSMDKVIGLAVSGIAGPGGGMPGKPVGLVWIGLSTPATNCAVSYHFKGNRIEIKEQSSDAALEYLLSYLQSIDKG